MDLPPIELKPSNLHNEKIKHEPLNLSKEVVLEFRHAIHKDDLISHALEMLIRNHTYKHS